MTATIDIGQLLSSYAKKTDVDDADAQEASRRAQAIEAANDAVVHEALLRQEAIQAINSALSGEILDRQEANGILDEAIRQEAARRTQAVQATNNALSGLGDELDGVKLDLVNSGLSALAALLGACRPGLCPSAFSNSALGPLASSSPLDPQGVVGSAIGRAYRMAGAGMMAPRAIYPVDPDAIFVLRARYWRQSDVPDPNNSAVDIGIQWLDARDLGAGYSLVRRERALSVQDGPKAITVRVPSLAGDRPQLVPPVGAVSWRPYLQTWGSAGATAVDVLGAWDATFAGVYAPDVYALANDLRTIQAQIAAGLPFSTPILPSYPVADLPTPGRRGRTTFAQDGRAPNLAGVLEAAGAGTGVDVVDNGTKWVISGTNQQVQA